VERTIGLPGGTLYGTGPTGVVWSHANLHGDIVTTTNPTGARTWSGYAGPFGENATPAPPNTTMVGASYGWHGKDQRYADRSITPMGARPYSPSLGRFLAVDPIEGGSANDYEYGSGDPCANLDISGRTHRDEHEFCRAVHDKVKYASHGDWVRAAYWVAKREKKKAFFNVVSGAASEVVKRFVEGGVRKVAPRMLRFVPGVGFAATFVDAMCALDTYARRKDGN
jgi:RHS repeat-associated protein